MKKTYLFLSVLAITLFSCASDSEDDLDNNNNQNTQITYTNTISGIVSSSCATSGCHDSNTKRSGVELTDYNLVKASFQGRGIIRIKAGTMPPSGPLPASTIAKIDDWIANNFPN